MAFSPVPPFPALSDRAAGTYNGKAFDFAMHMATTFVNEANAFAANISSFAAGGAYAFPYTFDSITTDSVPGVGKLRLANATQNTSTNIRIDNSMAGGADLSAIWTSLLAGTSAVKGSLRIVKSGDVSQWMILDVTGSTATTGYRNLVVIVRASSSPSPFVNGDSLIVYIQRSGDMGAGTQVKLGEATVSSPVAQIDFLNVFNAACNKYVIELEGITPSVSSILGMRLAVAGAAVNSSSYYGPAAPGSTTSAVTHISFGTQTSATGPNSAFTVEIRNANAPVAKSFTVSGSKASSGSAGLVGGEGFFSATAAATGLQLFWTGGENFIAGTVRIYGILN